MSYEETKLGDYMYAIEWPTLEERKTKAWGVYSSKNDFHLGVISWYIKWRQYTFNPTRDSTFNAVCLQILTDHLKKLNEEHRKKD